MKNTQKHINGLKPYKIRNKAEMREVLWLIKEGAFQSVEQYLNHMTLLINGKLKDVDGKLIPA